MSLLMLNLLLSAKQKSETEVKEEPGENKELTRTLKGVMRVGVLAKVGRKKESEKAGRSVHLTSSKWLDAAQWVESL